MTLKEADAEKNPAVEAGGGVTMEQAWKLGEDLCAQDSLLDGLTFDDLILAVHCSCRTATPAGVRKQLNEMLAGRIQDMNSLVENNMEAIIIAAMKGRD